MEMWSGPVWLGAAMTRVDVPGPRTAESGLPPGLPMVLKVVKAGAGSPAPSRMVLGMMRGTAVDGAAVAAGAENVEVVAEVR